MTIIMNDSLEKVKRILLRLFIQESLVSSKEEAITIVDAILDDVINDRCTSPVEHVDSCNDSTIRRTHSTIGSVKDIPLQKESELCAMIKYALQEYFQLPNDDIMFLVKKYTSGRTTGRLSSTTTVAAMEDDDNDSICCNDNDQHDKVNNGDNNSNDDNDYDDDVYIGPGECILCERYIKRLTRHHLIPRCTWKRMESMIYKHWYQFQQQQKQRQQGQSTVSSITNDEVNNDPNVFDHLIPVINQLITSSFVNNKQRSTTTATNNSTHVKRLIRTCIFTSQEYNMIDVCRSCHDHIHKSYDNVTLGLQYNTFQKLIDDPIIYKYAKWAHDQKIKKGEKDIGKPIRNRQS